MIKNTSFSWETELIQGYFFLLVDIVKMMYDLGATVEYVPEDEVGNPEICFYHIYCQYKC